LLVEDAPVELSEGVGIREGESQSVTVAGQGVDEATFNGLVCFFLIAALLVARLEF